MGFGSSNSTFSSFAPQTGHTLEFGNIKHVLHSIPSGIFHPNKINIIGNGVVIDPVIFKNEIESVDKYNLNLKNTLFISKKAHLILPSHRQLDLASEKAKGTTKIGSTLKGIGPTYMDKTGRNGLRVGDILSGNFIDRYNQLVSKHKQLFKMYGFSPELEEYEKQWFEGIELLKSFNIVDSEYEINQLLNNDKSLLAEGAQGTLLDIDFGSYPYVTSSNTTCAGACVGLGIAPRKIGEVFGIFKAYCTRVGSGPFPTELFDETGIKLQKEGNEFGATTGRPRRCGWLDLVALKYSIMLNGVTQLIMTKTDVLDSFEVIRVCVAYKHNNEIIDTFPFDTNADIEPIYIEYKGWKTDLTECRDRKEFPKELKEYIDSIEEEVGVPIKFVSVGPDRKQIINM